MRTDSRGWLWVFLGVLVLALLFTPLVMGPWMMGGVMGPWMMGGTWQAAPGSAQPGWGWGLAMALGWLGMLAFWGLIALSLVFLVRWARGLDHGAPQQTPESPSEILKRRLAAGEITRAQYEELSQVLRG